MSWASAHGALLDELGTRQRPHSGRCLREHLDGTAALLQRWGCREAVCCAGQFHSIYGTDAFAVGSLALGQRARLRAAIGEEAERLVYLFGAAGRPHALFAALRDGGLRDRRDGVWHDVTADEARDLLAIECANLVEQQAHHGLLALLGTLPGTQRRALLGVTLAGALSDLLAVQPGESA